MQGGKQMNKEKNVVVETKNMSEEELEAVLSGEKEELEDIQKEAELNSQQDSISDQETSDTKINYVIKFKKPYYFNNNEINEIDLSGLENLTTLDGQAVEQEMFYLKHYPRNKFQDTLYCKHLAMRATGLPADFFNMLRLKDMAEIVSTVTYYFLFG